MGKARLTGDGQEKVTRQEATWSLVHMISSPWVICYLRTLPPSSLVQLVRFSLRFTHPVVLPSGTGVALPLRGTGRGTTGRGNETRPYDEQSDSEARRLLPQADSLVTQAAGTGIKEILTRDNRDSFPGTPFTPVRLSLTSVHCSLRPYHSSLHLLPCSLLTCGSLRYGTDMKNEEMSG